MLPRKNTKPLVLGSTSFFSLKNDLKIFLSMEAYGKGGPAFKHVTLLDWAYTKLGMIW